MTKNEQIIYLHLMGLRNAQISRRLAASESQVSQLLARNPAARKRKILMANLPSMKAEPGETQPPRDKALTAKQLEQCRRILKKSDFWTWLEANNELKENGLLPPAPLITKLLREAGFEYSQKSKAWSK